MPTVPTSTLKIVHDCFLHWFVAYLLTGDMLTLSYTGIEMCPDDKEEGRRSWDHLDVAAGRFRERKAVIGDDGQDPVLRSNDFGRN